MKVLDSNSLVTYSPPDHTNLLLAEWKAKVCEIDATTTSTVTNETSTVAIIRALTISELLSSELMQTTPEEVAELYLLCHEDAKSAFESYRMNLPTTIGGVGEIAWVGNAFFYLRENKEIRTSTVNLLTGDEVPGMEHLLQKYPLTAQLQQPQVEPSISLEQGLQKMLDQTPGTLSKDQVAEFQCLLVQRTTTTAHKPGDANIEKDSQQSERAATARVEMPSPHLASTAIIYTPLLVYPIEGDSHQLVYDPTIGRLYLSDINNDRK